MATKAEIEKDLKEAIKQVSKEAFLKAMTVDQSKAKNTKELMELMSQTFGDNMANMANSILEKSKEYFSAPY